MTCRRTPCRVVMTGATGFIGRNLLSQLAVSGTELHVLSRGPGLPSHPDVIHHPIDLLAEDPADLLHTLKPDGLVHLAWEARPGLFWNAPENLDWLGASLRLVRRFASSGGHRLLVTGTCAEYDWSFPRLDERRTPLRPHSLYGKSKLALFQTLEQALPALGVSMAWARIFFPYGPDEAAGRLVSGLIDGLATGQRVSTSPGLQMRDFLHVSDAATAIDRLFRSDVEGAVNIASGRVVPVKTVVSLIARELAAEHLVDIGGRAAQANEPHRMEADTSILCHQLGFQPSFTLEQGIEQTVRERLRLTRIAPPSE